ncbi:MAG: hypothetical protein A2Y88_09680 [Chloroflexi bacterium RBG_13_48_10]|nr:MAG: hypothetical protein A2Y88_09680 [Chloroflexi bacterium RBG_13_48_10]
MLLQADNKNDITSTILDIVNIFGWPDDFKSYSSDNCRSARIIRGITLGVERYMTDARIGNIAYKKAEKETYQTSLFQY